MSWAILALNIGMRMLASKDNVDRVEVHGLQVAKNLYDFIENEVFPGSGIEGWRFWPGLAAILKRFSPRNEALLKQREKFQTSIDQWHQTQKVLAATDEYKKFLKDIGYILPEGSRFSIDTTNVDPEIALIAGPQLVVPATNARYALNAVNARWGSLYDALYGSDAIEPRSLEQASATYDPKRGTKVIKWCRDFLDTAVPLSSGSHSDVSEYIATGGFLTAIMSDGKTVGLLNDKQFRGYRGSWRRPEALLLENHGLHIEIVIDRGTPIGRSDAAGVADILIEAALTTIIDFEDSVAAVDPVDKVLAYRNWLGLCKGTLTTSFLKDGEQITRGLNPNRTYVGLSGEHLELPGRSLMLVRNVGLLMHDTSVLDQHGNPAPEGILDAAISCLIALHDVDGDHRRNSRMGAIYIVKPKLHGPDEVFFIDELFSAIEEMLWLGRDTIKLGLMDEERRTTINLMECIRAAKSRIFFINTGFLDRTGDEIHTSMEAGPVLRKGDMKTHAWLKAYENRNVEIGLECGFPGRAQIGKGMWAMPDEMRAMLVQKIQQVEAGANTAWVPSPTAATLHATHYHQIDVAMIQSGLHRRKRTELTHVLALPIAKNPAWTPEEIQTELDNNVQGILGYVVGWINEGIGCSKVPDIHNVNLMEDRATLRISSQHIANWLRHGIVSKDQVTRTLQRMVSIVDKQNRNNQSYKPMGPDFDSSPAFLAARDLIFKGAKQPNGYTDPILHAYRSRYKKEHYGSPEDIWQTLGPL